MDNLWILNIIMETWSVDSDEPVAREQVMLDSSGILLHRKHEGKLLVVNRNLPVTDREALSSLGSKLLGNYRISKWEQKYAILVGGFKKLRYSGSDDYRMWRVEYRRGVRKYVIEGDILPDRAAELRDDILALSKFDPVPELFFLAPDGSCALPSAEELIARI